MSEKIFSDVDEEVLADPLQGAIFNTVVNRGTISAGELYVTPDLDPRAVNKALGALVQRGLITSTGGYYSLSAHGSQVARRRRFLGKSAI